MTNGDMQQKHTVVLQDTEHYPGCYINAKLAVGACRGRRTT